ncbi:MAG: peptide deformylase [Bdellovibrionales bacterium]|nr:peptide deformylase [Bdellovibrionales bacterium]
MKALDILRFPDPRLRQKGKKVIQITPELKTLGEKMLQTMYAEKGVGLAAIQVGQPVRLIVVDTRPLSDENESRYDNSTLKSELEKGIKQPLILFNPEIVEKKGQVVFSEGCLSFPSYFAEVKRAETITLTALNLHNQEMSLTTDGLLSICLQHEVDHLDGKLFIDYLSPVKAARLREDIKKHGYPEGARADSRNL